MTNEYSIQLLFSANLCVLLSREACDPSSDSVNSKILCDLCDLCVRKQNICVVIIYLTQRAQRTRRFISLLLTLTLKWSQVSLRRENAEVG